VKKLLVLFLLMVYTVAGNGAVLSIHFCMGDYSGISFEQKESPICGKCGMKDKDGCCHDEVQIIKFDSPVTKSICFSFGPIDPLLNQPREFSISEISILSLLKVRPLAFQEYYKGPPLHILNCNFRI